MTITEVIVGNTTPTENHLILSEDLFGSNPKQLKKLRGIKESGTPKQVCAPKVINMLGPT